MFPRSRVLLATLVTFSLLAAATLAQFQPQGIDRSQLMKLKGQKPFERWLWEFEQRAYPLGRIPDGAKQRAFQRTKEAKAAALTSENLTGTVWQSLGPEPILGGQTVPPSPVAGRVADVAVDPALASHWLIGTAQGGIWETFDSGSTWFPRTDDQPTLAMGAIAFAPSDPDIVYAGTGEAVFAGDAYGGAGVLKSTDGGRSWQLIASSPFSKMAFSDIKVDPATPNVLLAAVARGLGVPAGQGGVYKSTNGGVSWSQKLAGVATDLEVNPLNFNTQYAGIGEVLGSAQNGLYRSFNGGETWSAVSGPWTTAFGGVGRVELAIAPSNPDVLYVSVQDAVNFQGADRQLLGVWKTINASSANPTWTALPSSSFFSELQWWYDHDSIVDPSDPNTLYLGGISLGKFDGTSWTILSSGSGIIHADQQSLAWAGNRLIVGNDGGVWSTTNAGSTWTNHNAELSITQFYLGSIHPTDPNFAIGGSQDNGTSKWTGNPAWQLILLGDGADNAISSVNPDTHWAASVFELQIVRTIDGQSFHVAFSGIDRTGAPFIAEFEKCPNNDNVFIAGTDNLWKSTNFFLGGSPTWTTNGPEMGSTAIVSMAFAASDSSCGTYAYATGNGQIRLTTNGGTTWTDIDSGNAVPNRFITDLAFDPTNANVLYLTLSGFNEGPQGPGHVFKTTNSLAPSPAWTNISTPVNLPHNALVIDSSSPNNIYVGTDLSVWNSTDGGSSWGVTGTGLPSVAVFDLQLNPSTDRLIAFTHGRGAFGLIVPVAVSPPSGLAATAISGSQVNTTWMAPGGSVDHYELQRSQNVSGPFHTIASTSNPNFTDTNLTGLKSSVAYLYRVRAVDAQGNKSSFSNVDLATTMSYTDDPLVAGSTVIKAQHINELRIAVNAVRTTAGLPPASWTDGTLPGVFIKAVHITELRQNLDQGLSLIGISSPLYTDPTLNPGLIVKKVHIEEIRQAVR